MHKNEILSDKVNNLYDEDILYNKIKNKYGDEYNIYISTNNRKLAQSTKLNEFIFYNENNIYEAYIDQYICSQAEIFYFSPFNSFTSSSLNNLHTRSTFSSFINDYRLYNLELPVTSNITLISLNFGTVKRE